MKTEPAAESQPHKCEWRLRIPDPHSEAARGRIAAEVARLNLDSERDALDWIEQVGDFDEPQ
jgi:hypothetical protein